MTSKVTIDAHAGWPIRATLQSETGEISDFMVPAGEVRDCHVWQGVVLTITEVPKSANTGMQEQN